MQRFYISLLLLCLATSFTHAQEVINDISEPLFPNLDQALYQDAAHAYDDDLVIMLSRRRMPALQSRLVPVQQGDIIDLETYVHYTKSGTKTWQKVGATAAGLAIGSLPYLLDRGGNSEGLIDNDLLKQVAPLAGIGVASLPFVLKNRKGQPLSGRVSVPKGKNGMFVPDAYLKYNFYDREGILLESDYQMIDRQAKDAWQKLAIHKAISQDGYVQIELGNNSKRPVWMDGVKTQQQKKFNKDGRTSYNSGNEPNSGSGGGIDVPGTNLGGDCITNCGDSDDDKKDNSDDDKDGGDRSYTIEGDGTPENPYNHVVRIYYDQPNGSPTIVSIGYNFYYGRGGYIDGSYYPKGYYYLTYSGNTDPVAGTASSQVKGGEPEKDPIDGVSGLHNVSHRFKLTMVNTKNYFCKWRKILEDRHGPITSYFHKLKFFYDMVKHKAPFDIKQDGKGYSERELEDQRAVFCEGITGSSNCDYYRFDDFGNINYGVAAEALGIARGDAMSGAGFQQLLGEGFGDVDFSNVEGFFDEAQDTQMIKKGFGEFYDLGGCNG